MSPVRFLYRPRVCLLNQSIYLETEFEKYKKACVDGNTSLPTYAHLEQKQKDIKYALEYRYIIGGGPPLYITCTYEKKTFVWLSVTIM